MRTSETIPGLTEHEKKILDTFDEVIDECDEIEKMLHNDTDISVIHKKNFQNVLKLQTIMES